MCLILCSLCRRHSCPVSKLPIIDRFGINVTNVKNALVPKRISECLFELKPSIAIAFLIPLQKLCRILMPFRADRTAFAWNPIGSAWVSPRHLSVHVLPLTTDWRLTSRRP